MGVTPRPRQQRSVDTLAAVTGAARDLFGRFGPAAVGIDDVAGACGRTKGAVYHHFATKEALFEEVFRIEQRRLAEHVRSRVASPDSVEALVEGVEAYLDEIAADPLAARITLLDAPTVLGWAEWRRCDGGPFRAMLSEAFGAVARRGRLASGAEPGWAADALLGAVTESGLVVATSSDPSSAVAPAVRACRAVARGLAN